MFQFQEDFLHLIWKYQYFDKKQLETTQGLLLSIVKIGFHNQHEGPDFKEAHILMDEINYHGHVEIHLRSSDWKSHKHQSDERYNSVVLHVVWEHDEEVKRKDGTSLPTLLLKGRVFLDVVRNYERLLSSPKKILCAEGLSQIPDILKFSMLEKALIERFHAKSQIVLELLEQNQNDWEETAYQWLFYSFGFRTNKDPMLKLARSLPYKIIKKNAGNLKTLEALLFGQADLIPNLLDFEQDKVNEIRVEYSFLRKKYPIQPNVHSSEWKFMKVRPINFPTVRLAQLAALLNQSPHIFSAVLYELQDRKSFEAIFELTVSAYWKEHYHFGKSNKKKSSGKLSTAVLDLLAINFVIPLWYAYGRYVDLMDWQEKCFNFLQEIPPEENSIIDLFREENWPALNAFDTQGMLGLYREYCNQRKCLNCKIGQNLLRPQ
ncbi:MAG: DUF2851 family protein [Cyclobacteriaceae bacterium]